MRISGGRARGVHLRVSKNAVHRPAMDKLRQSVFSSLGAAVEDAKVCDLFAGTGSYGLEALSRGAASATFVENHKGAVKMIRDNLPIVAKSMGEPRLDATVLPLDVLRWQGDAQTYDLVFVDPPYDLILDNRDTLFALVSKILNQNGTIIFEMPGHLDLEPQGWRLRKRFGKTKRNEPTCSLYERA
ncbi:MAG: RsmD family RNA methyltransferase [Verrucomicrobiota bacterium]